MERRPELIFFDLDGTLIDSSRDIAAAANQALRSEGLGLCSLERVTAAIGRGPRQLFIQLLGDVSDRILLDRLVSAFRKAYEARLSEETIVYPGIEEMLDRLADHPKVVLTNKSQRHADALIDELGLRRHFEGVFGAEAFPTRKPDPQPLLRILKSRGVEASRAVIVGDTVVDITAGRQAGVKTVAALYGYGDEQAIRALEPDFLVDAPLQLARLFEETST